MCMWVDRSVGIRVLYRIFLPGEKLDSLYFSTCIVCFALLWFCCLVLFGSGSLNVNSETVFIYILMFSVHVVIKFQGRISWSPPSV